MICYVVRLVHDVLLRPTSAEILPSFDVTTPPHQIFWGDQVGGLVVMDVLYYLYMFHA